MATTTRTSDIWIVETNTVYRQVPFTVVTDWIQQGRLLPDDRVRATPDKWVTLKEVPAFAPYFPKAEPYRAEDKAEALEPVHVDFAWRPGQGEEDNDVDMIPLIDVSLVLLIFFMLTATVGGAGALINTPEAAYKHLQPVREDMLWVGIDRSADGQPVFSMGEGSGGAGDKFANRAALVAAVRQRLQSAPNPVVVSVRAHRDLPCEVVVQDMALDLQGLTATGKIAKLVTEVTEKKQ